MAAVTDSYAGVDLYRARAGMTDDGDDPSIVADLAAVSRYLDAICGQFFTKDASDTTRVYMPTRPARRSVYGWAESENPYLYGGFQRQLFIDPIAAVTSITIDTDNDGSFTDETALTTNDYELLPRNADKGPEPKPWTCIELTTWGAQVSFPTTCRVQVVGRFGWPAVPPAIVTACVELARLLRLETPRATMRIDDVGTSVGTSRRAQEIVDSIRRQYQRKDGLI